MSFHVGFAEGALPSGPGAAGPAAGTFSFSSSTRGFLAEEAEMLGPASWISLRAESSATSDLRFRAISDEEVDEFELLMYTVVVH